MYDVWKGDGGKTITSFSIITTAVALSTSQYHDQMPLVLDEGQFEDWMRGPADLAAEMMKPYDGTIDIWQVGAEVGNVWNSRPELMDRAALL